MTGIEDPRVTAARRALAGDSPEDLRTALTGVIAAYLDAQDLTVAACTAAYLTGAEQARQ